MASGYWQLLSCRVVCGFVELLKRHYADFFFDLRSLYHYNRVPRATIQEASIRPFADTLLAADAKDGVHLNPAERCVVFVWHPEHAIFDRAVFNACRRAGTAGAALGDHRKFFGFFLANGVDALRFGLVLKFVGNHAYG
jgi:hypothetical protein